MCDSAAALVLASFRIFFWDCSAQYPAVRPHRSCASRTSLLTLSARHSKVSLNPAYAARCNADCPLLLRMLTSAFSSISIWHTCLEGAKKIGVCPCRSWTFTSERESINNEISSRWPSKTATWMGLTSMISLQSTVLPLLSKSLHSFTCWLCTAKLNAVCLPIQPLGSPPFCMACSTALTLSSPRKTPKTAPQNEGAVLLTMDCAERWNVFGLYPFLSTC